MAVPGEFQLGLLPERKIDWRTIATSYGLVTLFVLGLINLGLVWPERLHLAQNYHFTELIPVPALQPERIEPQPVLHTKLLPAVSTTQPKMIVPHEVHAPRPAEELAPPKVMVHNFTAPELKVSGGARPLQVVRTGEFGSSAPPTLNVPIQKVQTGGFGDPNGIPGQGKQGAHLVAANLGSFDLPQGPGHGNGTGGANGLKGTVASAGFGNGMAVPGQGDGRSNGKGVATGGFGAQQIQQTSHAAPRSDIGPATTPVEITYKPNPIYTDEARQLKLEGEVLLEVMFAANGELHVNRVVRGLGHGLDEAAVAAANRMRFKPALRNGVAADSTAVVHVRFQLAY
jgi:TonB family protein